MNENSILSEMAQSIIQGDRDKASSLARQALDKGMDLNSVIEEGYIPGIQKVGDLWEEGEYFLPELISSAECMKAVMGILQPVLEKEKITARSIGKIIIGTIEGDIHDIGKNLVSSMLSANGFDVIDLGADVRLDKFIETAEEKQADLICLSALLTTTMLGQKKLIEKLRERELSDRFKVMVGGSPVTQKWADDIGADGYAENAMTAVAAVKNLLNK